MDFFGGSTEFVQIKAVKHMFFRPGMMIKTTNI